MSGIAAIGAIDIRDCHFCIRGNRRRCERAAGVREAAAGKDFQCKIYKDASGRHNFNRTDTTLARESRKEIHAFPQKYLVTR